MIVLGIFFIVLQALDLATTYVLIKRPNLEEKNPLMKRLGSNRSFVLLGILKSIPCVLFLYLLIMVDSHMVNIVVFVFDVFMFVVVANNISWFFR